MENYFQYFSEIEEHFRQRRGTTLLLSTLDWALIESWKEQNIPLAAVLRGIDQAFESFDKRPRKGRKVNSLAYCSQAVTEAAEQMNEAALGSVPRPQPEISKTEIAGYLRTNAEALERQDRPALGEICSSLRALAAGLEAAGDLANLEELERRLTVLEEKLFAALISVCSEDELLTLRREAEHAMANYRREMRGAQLEQLEKQFVRKRLLERHSLPRLSLFYMR